MFFENKSFHWERCVQGGKRRARRGAQNAVRGAQGVVRRVRGRRAVNAQRCAKRCAKRRARWSAGRGALAAGILKMQNEKLGERLFIFKMYTFGSEMYTLMRECTP